MVATVAEELIAFFQKSAELTAFHHHDHLINDPLVGKYDTVMFSFSPFSSTDPGGGIGVRFMKETTPLDISLGLDISLLDEDSITEVELFRRQVSLRNNQLTEMFRTKALTESGELDQVEKLLARYSPAEDCLEGVALKVAEAEFPFCAYH